MYPGIGSVQRPGIHPEGVDGALVLSVMRTLGRRSWGGGGSRLDRVEKGIPENKMKQKQ